MSMRVRFYLTAIALGALHLALVNHFVPLKAVFSHSPLTGDDFDLHIGQVARVVEGLRDYGHAWVYDVKLVAGQPEGTITDSGSKGWELFTYALTRLGVHQAVAFNLFVLLVMLAAPFCSYAAARGFELDRRASLVAAALTSLLWFFDSCLHWLWFIGMVSYALATCLGTLTLALFFQFIVRGRTLLALPAAICLALGHLIHPYTFFTLAPPIAVLYFRAFRSAPRRTHVALVGCAALTLAVNAYWLRNAAIHWHYVLDSAFYGQARIEYLLTDFLGILRSGGDTGVVGPRFGFRMLCFGLACGGLWRLRRAKDPRFWPLAVAMLWPLALAYFGGIIPFAAQIQPYRHLAPAALFSTLPAAAFVRELARERELANAALGVRIVLGVSALLVVQHLAIQALYFLPRLIPETEHFADGSPSSLSKYGYLALHDGPTHVHYGVPHEKFLELGTDEAIAWLEKHAPKGARVLAEGNLLGERIAWKTELEVMGGFIERNVAHAYANYFRQFDKHPLAPPELGRYLRTFAIGWVVTLKDHPEFERASDVLERMTVAGGRTIYRVRTPSTNVLRGGGKLYARTNHLALWGADPNTDVVLSYHFHEALRCAPGCKLEREDTPFDRVGLIRIPAPHPRDLLVYNAYE